MNSFTHLLVLSLLTFIGSFLAGSLPLALSLKEEQLNLLSTFSSGLLIGTSLSVILPEGIETLYNIQPSIKPNNIILNFDDDDDDGDDTINDNNISASDKSHNTKNNQKQQQQQQQQDSKTPPPSSNNDSSGKDNEYNHFEPHKYIGPSLSGGFIFMFLLENLGPSAHPHGEDDSSALLNNNNNGNLESKARKTLPATIGLLVHCAADGIALGAAASSTNDSIEFIVFLAIILHKAPSALGYTVFLMHEGHTRRSVKQHLIAFAASVPISALLTFTILHSILAVDEKNNVNIPNDNSNSNNNNNNRNLDNGRVTKNASDMSKWTGILLLFSAGTFLYVATVHILPQIYNNNNNNNNNNDGSNNNNNNNIRRRSSPVSDNENGVLLLTNRNDDERRNNNRSSSSVHGHGGEKVLSKMQLVAWVLGALAPFLLAIEHSH